MITQLTEPEAIRAKQTRAVDLVMEHDDEGAFLHYREVKKLKDVRDGVVGRVSESENSI